MTIPQPDLEAVLKKTVLLYNRLRSPEAVAKIIQVTPEIVVISLSGSFCYDCGDVQKYVDDFAKDFKIFIDYAELIAPKTRETSPRSVEVSYMVKTR